MISRLGRPALGVVAASAATLLVAALASSPSSVSSSSGPVNGRLPWHGARTDGAGRLVPWYRPEQGLGYDHVLRAGWNFVERSVPVDRKTKRRVYLSYAVFDGRTHQGTYWQHNPASLYASFVDSLLPWYAYSGDTRAIAVVRAMLEYQLDHGTTRGDWAWARVPFATSCAGSPRYGRCLAGMPRAFYGGIEPDKVGMLGLGYARFYELTGERRFLRAAVACGRALASHVHEGDATHTPWPFRVDARTGRTLEGATYGGTIVAPIWLFAELGRLHAGPAAMFARARRIAWRWLLRYPLNPSSRTFEQWSGHYEDIEYDPTDLNQAAPTTTALYLLSQPSPRRVDVLWRTHVAGLLEWVRTYLGRGPFHGAWGIDEQRSTRNGFGCCSTAGLGSDTARWAAAEALYAARTGDPAAAASARSSLAYSTYFMRSDGAVSCCGAGIPQAYWFSDGYGDYLKSFSTALGALPQLAPPHQDHLLRSTSVIQHVTYRPDGVDYRTFDSQSTELLRLRSRPVRVTADQRPLVRRKNLAAEGYVIKALRDGDVVVAIRHDRSREITIR